MGFKLLKIWFQDETHVNLKIQLKYHGLKQSQFFNTVIKSYLEKDPAFMNYFVEATKSVRGMRRNSKVLNDAKQEKKTKEEFALDENDIKSIFDILEMENPDL